MMMKLNLYVKHNATVKDIENLLTAVKLYNGTLRSVDLVGDVYYTTYFAKAPLIEDSWEI